MKVDLSKLNMIISGEEIEGVAESANLTLPAPKPVGPVFTCDHLDYEDPKLMTLGSVFVGSTSTWGKTNFVLCVHCVLACQIHPEASPLGTVRQRVQKAGRIVMDIIHQIKTETNPFMQMKVFLNDLDEENNIEIWVKVLPKNLEKGKINER